MKSQIDDKLSERERELFKVLMTKKANFSKAIRISLQYILAASIFVFLAIYDNQPLYSIGVFIIVIIVLAVPMIKSMKIKNEIPEILQKYDNEIKVLKSK
ncbi:MAG: hypothetical protein UV80_C0008G0035 [Candidatus Peregrinibacteria bacterium GW2011_GWF2_43_17]|nr:MAG: hypothetical protein UV80_C0008G0035 [Candidatus Peregrinibacteria bacterium GW2011_GWF2_43_17]KKT18906.1 MAG: hypothetical protein UW03_C0028G0022 [Candidatus Peregrinibacteria bacterium GW2011_GWA2_43_8]HAU39501.1 hypothetical protein [Candidatus Peregrinibacteria bacterium]